MTSFDRLSRQGLAVLAPFAVFVAAGCGLAASNVPQPRSMAQAAPAEREKPAKTGQAAPERRVGDFFVHRFSGSFASEPLTLTEEVIAQDAQAWVVDFSLAQSDRVERLRVRFDAASGRALSAARYEGDREIPATLADYVALVGRTVYAADVNDGLVSSTTQTCLVGSDELDCETKTYKVWVGDAAATLSVVHSKSYADRDVSGEITGDDGKLLYRAELVEARQGKPSIGVASR
jgi:hypothetical protein